MSDEITLSSLIMVITSLMVTFGKNASPYLIGLLAQALRTPRNDSGFRLGHRGLNQQRDHGAHTVKLSGLGHLLPA